MFGFEKKFGNKKTEAAEVPSTEDMTTEAGTEEDYNVDMGRRNFLRQSVAAATTVGIAVAGMTPESAEAAESKAQIELVPNLTLSPHNMKLLKIRLGKIVPDAASVQISLRHTDWKENGKNEKFSLVDLDVITSSGEVRSGKGMVFGTVKDDAGINRMLTLALDDLAERANQK